MDIDIDKLADFLEKLDNVFGFDAASYKDRAREVKLFVKEENKFQAIMSDCATAKPLNVTIEVMESGVLEIRPEGYGNCNMDDGNGSPLYLDLHEGKLQIVYFDDINEEDNKSISLEGARESNRKEN